MGHLSSNRQAELDPRWRVEIEAEAIVPAAL
jgi:hypothetical protein